MEDHRICLNLHVLSAKMKVANAERVSLPGTDSRRQREFPYREKCNIKIFNVSVKQETKQCLSLVKTLKLLQKSELLMTLLVLFIGISRFTA
jgi:hypothetical protein